VESIGGLFSERRAVLMIAGRDQTRLITSVETQISVGSDDVELGGLLVLLHAADAPFRSVQATYRVWRHQERLHVAFMAHAEERKRRGASISTLGFGKRDREPPEREETIRIWREGERCREEHEGGDRDGYYAVADGPRWWTWDERMGASSNHDDPSVGSGVGQELRIMLDPTALLSALCFRVTGTSQLAGRRTATALATPRPEDPGFGRAFGLHNLGTGAECYLLEVDGERGVLLASTAFRDEQPFYAITTLAIAFDEPIAEEVSQFQPPEGEEIHGIRDRFRVRHLTLTEAQRLAPFTVLMPDRVSADWQVSCTFMDASERPPSPPQVSLHYRSDDGHESIHISQMAAVDRESPYEQMISDDRWHEAVRDGATVMVTRAGFGQAQAHLERDGTFVFIVSDNLTSEQLATIAAGLRPAPTSGSI
jgi:hypothetical protein